MEGIGGAKGQIPKVNVLRITIIGVGLTQWTAWQPGAGGGEGERVYVEMGGAEKGRGRGRKKYCLTIKGKQI